MRTDLVQVSVSFLDRGFAEQRVDERTAARCLVFRARNLNIREAPHRADELLTSQKPMAHVVGHSFLRATLW